MSRQPSLFDEEPRYCIDTNVIVSFLRGTDDEHYGVDVFRPQWEHIQRLITSGAIVAPRQVEHELGKWCKTIPTMKEWLRKNKDMFRSVETEKQLLSAKKIVNAYPAYGESMNYLGDLEVMTLADTLGIAVVSLESQNPQNSRQRPKIPNICKEFGIDCVSLPGFLRREQFGTTAI
ncbi:DUF4411 family protein [Arthrobacter sp. UYCu723]